MHPILTYGSRLLLYLALWTLIGVLLALWLTVDPGLAWWNAAAVALPVAILYGFVCLSAWYVARGMPPAATHPVRLLVTALTAAALSSGVWVLLTNAWTDVLAGRSGLVFGFGVLLYLLSVAVSYVVTTMDAAQEVERRALEVQVLAREAELRSLRAQIDPHFLFNSLHSISALTTADPGAARRMCLLLADFLRDSLALGAQDRITLDQELGLAARFLAIEQVRFGDRLRIECTAGDAGGCLVPPLILQPIVENAVTHGIAHAIAGGTVVLRAARCGGLLAVRVESPCDADRPAAAGTGVGLANVRARLRALYGAEGRLTATERDGRWEVDLSLPATERAA